MKGIPAKSCIAIFLKDPVPGYVKTRLAVKIGHHNAAQLYKRMAESTIKKAASTQADVILFWGVMGAMAQEDSLSGFLHLEQRGEGLGERMLDALNCCKKLGYQQTVLIGTDIWSLSSDILCDALISLVQKDAVLGPAADGGYYLIGMKNPSEHIFRNIDWSTQTVLSSTIKRFKDLKLNIKCGPVLNDIDTWDDLVKEPSLLAFLPGYNEKEQSLKTSPNKKP